MSGQSSPSGFYITARGGPSPIRLETSDFRNEEWIQTKDLLAFLKIIFPSGNAIFWTLAILFSPMSILMILPLGLIFMIVWFVSVVFLAGLVAAARNPELKRWHGCEHKLLSIFRHNRPRTKAELERAWRIDPLFCGGMHASMAWSLALFTILATLFPFLILVWGSGAFVLMFLFSCVIQGFLTTTTPYNIHYDAALELAQRLDAEFEKKLALQ